MDNTARRMQIRSSSLESNRYSNEHRKHDVGQIPSSRSFRNLRSFGGSSGILRYSNWRIHAGVARISVRSLHAMSRFSSAHLRPRARARGKHCNYPSYFAINPRGKNARSRPSLFLPPVEQILLPSSRRMYRAERSRFVGYSCDSYKQTVGGKIVATFLTSFQLVNLLRAEYFRVERERRFFRPSGPTIKRERRDARLYPSGIRRVVAVSSTRWGRSSPSFPEGR